MKLKACTREEYESFVTQNRDRMIEGFARSCFPLFVVWCDKNAVRGSIGWIVATRTFETQDAPEEFQIPESGELNNTNEL